MRWSVEAAADMWASGLSAKRIAAELGVKYSTISSYINRHHETFPYGGSHARRRHLPDEDRELAARLYSEGVSRAEIARRLGTSRAVAGYWAKRGVGGE